MLCPICGRYCFVGTVSIHFRVVLPAMFDFLLEITILYNLSNSLVRLSHFLQFANFHAFNQFLAGKSETLYIQ